MKNTSERRALTAIAKPTSLPEQVNLAEGAIGQLDPTDPVRDLFGEIMLAESAEQAATLAKRTIAALSRKPDPINAAAEDNRSPVDRIMAAMRGDTAPSACEPRYDQANRELMNKARSNYTVKTKAARRQDAIDKALENEQPEPRSVMSKPSYQSTTGQQVFY